MVLGELTDLFGNPRSQFYTWNPHFWASKFSLVKIAPFHAVKKIKSSVVQTKKRTWCNLPSSDHNQAWSAEKSTI